MLWALNDLKIVGSWCYGVNDWPPRRRTDRVGAAYLSSGSSPAVFPWKTPEPASNASGSDATEDMKVLINYNVKRNKGEPMKALVFQSPEQRGRDRYRRSGNRA